jgi:hypothetical protein
MIIYEVMALISVTILEACSKSHFQLKVVFFALYVLGFPVSSVQVCDICYLKEPLHFHLSDATKILSEKSVKVLDRNKERVYPFSVTNYVTLAPSLLYI